MASDFVEWGTNYPTSQDTLSEDQPDVQNNPAATPRPAGTGNSTRVSQIHTLRDKLDEVAKKVGDDNSLPEGSILDRIDDLEASSTSIPLDTVGDLLTYDGEALAKLPIPPLDDLVLVSDTSEPYKMKWAQVPGHAAAHIGTDPWIRETKVSGYYANEQFGSAVAVSGNTIVAGSANAEHRVNIWVKEAGFWKFQQMLDYSTDETISSTSGFGNKNIDIDEDTLIVGKYLYNSNKGNVDIWVRADGVWTLQQTLTAPDTASDRHFGNSVAISGDTCVIGANYDDDEASNAGAVYIFTRSDTTWSFEQKITASDATSSDYFGWAVDIEDDTLVASAYGYYKVYFFNRVDTTWTETESFVGNYGVSISGNWAATGAANGYAKIYKRADTESAWILHTTLDNPEELTHDEPYDRFGTAIAISGDTFVAGVWNRYETVAGALIDCGVAYAYKLINNVWVLKQKLQPIIIDISANPYNHDPYKYEYGRSIAVEDNLIVIGEQWGSPEGGIGYERGAFYVYNYYADLITVLEAAELEYATTGEETPDDPVSFELTGSAPAGQGLANTPSGYRILVFRNGIKMNYLDVISGYNSYFYDTDDNEIDVLASGDADRYEVIFF